MGKNISPLRYPGGKAKIYDRIEKLFSRNKLSNVTYIEPFAGGCGLALLLLKNKMVDNLILNDIDKGVYSFWYSVLNYDTEFIDIIKKIDINIDEREKQKKRYKKKDDVDLKNKKELMKLGMATFYLNRVNRSGILKAGVIGGKNQNGNYKMDCRFNKEKLIKRILEISKYKENIKFYNLDVLDFIEELNKMEKENLFIFFDPPYYKRGSELYTNFFKYENHFNLSERIKNLDLDWIVTYDNCEEIKKMYNTYDIKEFDINYSLEKKIKGKEIVVFSKKLKPAF